MPLGPAAFGPMTDYWPFSRRCDAMEYAELDLHHTSSISAHARAPPDHSALPGARHSASNADNGIGGIPSPRICWKLASTYAAFRSCSATAT
jgi:hypothetical protein